ncbi:hypothetical protein BTVI_25069 [Pitangus sulphuratus]|nr:hypothetical protein BTVI_25069 [Pitangus sulphuratus]
MEDHKSAEINIGVGGCPKEAVTSCEAHGGAGSQQGPADLWGEEPVLEQPEPAEPYPMEKDPLISEEGFKLDSSEDGKSNSRDMETKVRRYDDNAVMIVKKLGRAEE